jgi:hypothetical protein
MLPNLIIIGAMKAGTTSLHYYLNVHPEISMSNEKELDFFIEEKNWRNGRNWYESKFMGKAKIYGESSVNYSTFPQAKNVPKRMYSLIPEAKLIYMLRDPIERIVSHYIHSYSNGNENRPFTKAVLDTNSEYIIRSKYYMQLEQFLNFYSKARMLIIGTEDLFSSRLKTLKKIFNFLEIDDAFDDTEFSTILHTSNKKLRNNQRINRPEIDESLKGELRDHLQNDVNRLRSFSGFKFENWSI